MNDITADPESTPGKQKLDVKFTGTTREYFGIWIVNVLLSIITLGIYSAWAKVRRKRYFYGNTSIDGHNFEYHAKPMSILIGRIIVFILIIGYNILVNVDPIFGLFSLVFLLAVPWLVNLGLRFNARMTSYRNIRFNFEGSYGGAFWALVLLPILASIPLGLTVPFATRRRLHYYYDGHRFGQSHFAVQPQLKQIYSVFFIAILLFIVTAAVIFFASQSIIDIAAIGYAFEALQYDPTAILSVLHQIILAYALLIIAIALPTVFYAVSTFNIALNTLMLDGKHSLESTIKPFKYFWILISNTFVTLCTFGLMAPWAHIRRMKYLAANIYVVTDGSLDEFIDAKGEDGSVTSSEYMDFDGIGFGI